MVCFSIAVEIQTDVKDWRRKLALQWAWWGRATPFPCYATSPSCLSKPLPSPAAAGPDPFFGDKKYPLLNPLLVLVLIASPPSLPNFFPSPTSLSLSEENYSG